MILISKVWFSFQDWHEQSDHDPDHREDGEGRNEEQCPQFGQLCIVWTVEASGTDFSGASVG